MKTAGAKQSQTRLIKQKIMLIASLTRRIVFLEIWLYYFIMYLMEAIWRIANYGIKATPLHYFRKRIFEVHRIQLTLFS